MGERVRDWLRWSLIVAILMIDQVLIGIIGRAVMQAWYLVSEKVAFETRRHL